MGAIFDAVLGHENDACMHICKKGKICRKKIPRIHIFNIAGMEWQLVSQNTLNQVMI